MRETHLTVAGTIATDPTVRRFDDGRQVLTFRMASTSRRYDGSTRSWVDGPTLWLKVSCWRDLAENAARSLRKRDRVLVMGRIRSDQWQTPEGGYRSDLSLDAESLGHDLTFGTSAFDRKVRVVAEQVLTEDAVVDPVTGEVLDSGEAGEPGRTGGEGAREVAAGAGSPGGREEEPDESEDDDDTRDLEAFAAGRELARSA